MRPVVFVCCFAIASFATRAAGQPLADFDAYVQLAVAEWEVTGLAVAVVKDGEVLFAKGYGIRELGSAAKVDEHTLFAIGSTTKAMTAAAIGMLVDEGKLDWDDPVTDHLPDFRLYDPFVTREITVRDLLTHRAGLPNADFLWYGQDSEAADILFRMRYVEPETSLRSSFTYQNIMYAAAGGVVQVSDMAQWMRFLLEGTTPDGTELLERDSRGALHAADAGGPGRVLPHAGGDESPLDDLRSGLVPTYLFTADAGVGAGQKRPPRLSYSACSGPGGSRFANWANGLNGLRASWVD